MIWNEVYVMTKILLVDDEVKIVDIVKLYMEKAGYEVVTAHNGLDAVKQFDQSIDLIVLDLMLPDLSGEEVCQRIRKESDVPIIMLTAKVAEQDVLTGFDLGADDYVMKPFSPKQLLARIQAILRRTNKADQKDSGLVIKPEQFEVWLNGEKIDLTLTEFKILHLLDTHKNKVFSRDEIISHTFGYDYEGYDRSLDSHIKNIRKKLNNNKVIKTVYGVGYKYGDDDV